MSTFAELPISKRTQKGLRDSGFVKPTPIQQRTLGFTLAGKDVLGEAATGSGKTLAFVIPLLERLVRLKWSRHDGLGALVLAPTRELSAQIFKVLQDVGRHHELPAGCVVGGRDLKQEQKLIVSRSILVCTPGRLQQHIDETPQFDVTTVQMLVIDEADRIMDMGFKETMDLIIQAMSPSAASRQTLLFSATLLNSVKTLASVALKDAETVSVSKDEIVPQRLHQFWMEVPIEKKIDTIIGFIKSHSNKKMIVFVSSCKQAKYLYESLRALKVTGPCLLYQLQGRLSLEKRMGTFDAFVAAKEAACLICTDIASRGVDIPKVDWVVQLDYPENFDQYVHRIGRTARYQSSGSSLIFVLSEETAKFESALTQTKINATRLFPDTKKTLPFASRLRSLLAKTPEIKHAAHKACLCYLRSLAILHRLHLSPEQLQMFAESLGLAQCPDGAAEAMQHLSSVAAEPDRKQKLSKLGRLKAKIAAKKEAKAAAVETPDNDDDNGWGDMADDLAAALGNEPTKKLSKLQRRQQRLDALRNLTSHQDANDELLMPKDPSAAAATPATRVSANKQQRDSDYTEAELQALRALKKQRLRFRSDGSARVRGAGGLAQAHAHQVFNEDE